MTLHPGCCALHLCPLTIYDCLRIPRFTSGRDRSFLCHAKGSRRDFRVGSRRPTLGELRSATGLIIGLYVTMHLSNHALGLISVRGQEAVRPWVMALWHSPPGQLLLYGSLVTHATIALYVLMRRRHYYMPAWEGVQILLGLTIPYLLLGPHCKHARHPRSDWNRHRLHLRDR